MVSTCGQRQSQKIKQQKGASMEGLVMVVSALLMMLLISHECAILMECGRSQSTLCATQRSLERSVTSEM